jgi:hypothetical protein
VYPVSRINAIRIKDDGKEKREEKKTRRRKGKEGRGG